MPTPCDITMQLPYTFHFNPFVYYTDIVTQPQRCQSHVLPYHQSQFLAELQTNTLPNYVWIGPNPLNNIHNGTIGQADSWLAGNIDPIITSPAFENSLIILTFDEGDDSGSVDRSGCCGYNSGGGHVVTILISPLVKKGFQSTTPETHYSLLRTIEDAWGLAHLGQTARVAPMSEFFPASGSARMVDASLFCPSTHVTTVSPSTELGAFGSFAALMRSVATGDLPPRRMQPRLLASGARLAELIAWSNARLHPC